MFNWLRELIIIRDEWKRQNKDYKVCESCEILKHELEVVRLENRQLLDRILEKPQSKEPLIDTSNIKPIVPKNIPWNVRRNMLEAEDRRKAQLLREVAKNTSSDSGGQKFATAASTESPMSVEALEEELGVKEDAIS